MSGLLKRLGLILLGMAVGGLLLVLLLIAWNYARPRPQRIINEDDVAAIRGRMDYDTSPTGLFLYDQRLLYRFKPNHRGYRKEDVRLEHATNSLGLLGRAEIREDPKTTRILVLGDSLAYGFGVPYTSSLVPQMQQLAGDDYQLANASCTGWNTNQQLTCYRRELSRVHWSTVVIAFCLNDLIHYQWGRLPDGTHDIVMEDSFSMLDRSLTAWRVKQLRRQFAADETTRPLSRHDDATTLAWDASRWSTYLQDDLLPFVRDPSRPALVIVVLPTANQFAAWAAGTPRDIAFYPQRQLLDFCRKHEVPCIDAAPAFELAEWSAADDGFLADDFYHFNEQGHRQLADFLWPRLEVLVADSQPLKDGD